MTVTVYVPEASPVICEVVAFVFQRYVGLFGLDTDTDAVPFVEPQVVGVDDGVSDSALDGATDTVVVAEQPALLTVTVYVPDARPVICEVVALVFQRYVGLFGLETDTDAVPLASPHVVAVDEGVRDGAVDAATDAVAVAEQPALCTVTV